MPPILLHQILLFSVAHRLICTTRVSRQLCMVQLSVNHSPEFAQAGRKFAQDGANAPDPIIVLWRPAIADRAEVFHHVVDVLARHAARQAAQEHHRDVRAQVGLRRLLSAPDRLCQGPRGNTYVNGVPP